MLSLTVPELCLNSSEKVKVDLLGVDEVFFNHILSSWVNLIMQVKGEVSLEDCHAMVEVCSIWMSWRSGSLYVNFFLDHPLALYLALLPIISLSWTCFLFPLCSQPQQLAKQGKLWELKIQLPENKVEKHWGDWGAWSRPGRDFTGWMEAWHWSNGVTDNKIALLFKFALTWYCLQLDSWHCSGLKIMYTHDEG